MHLHILLVRAGPFVVYCQHLLKYFMENESKINVTKLPIFNNQISFHMSCYKQYSGACISFKFIAKTFFIYHYTENKNKEYARLRTPPSIHHLLVFTYKNKSCDGNAKPGSKNTLQNKRHVQLLNVKVCTHYFLYY